jgi:hypothetical protein
MYVRNQNSRRVGDVRIPDAYSGNAIPRTNIAQMTDEEALRTAEESFRRGYVFEDMRRPESPGKLLHNFDIGSDSDREDDTTQEAVSKALSSEDVGSSSGGETIAAMRGHKPPPPPSKPVHTHHPHPHPGRPGFLKHLNIGTEELIIVGIILLLLWNGADIDLIIMLAAILFC